MVDGVVLIPGETGSNFGMDIMSKYPHLSELEKAGEIIIKSVIDTSMTVNDLKAYAEEKNIDLGTATKKDDIIAAIKAQG